jgi:AraC family transcriptional regulator, transcriptional activator of pobA
MDNFLKIKTINQLHEMLGYDKPKHPLVTIIDYAKLPKEIGHFDTKIVTDFYIISLKNPAPKSVQYGRQYYDFSDGTMMFIAPEQVFMVGEPDDKTEFKGWGLYFHPDILLKTNLANKIKSYNFFTYATNEALHLSDKERSVVSAIAETIKVEYDGNIDNYSQSVIVTAIEQILNYSERFYGRQFITRQKVNDDLVSKFENLLNQYFQTEVLSEKGLPTVGYFADKLYLSSSYLTDLLKKETGKTIKEYIQIQIIERAKNRLLNSNITVNEIAYELGFEYPQYFNRLFKSKTGMTPIEYRHQN